MHRFLVPRHALDADVVPLPPPDSHHAAVVLRLRPGDPVELLDGHGTVAAAHVDLVQRHLVQARVASRSQHPPQQPHVVLVAGLTKGKAWDWTLQKATEAGVSQVVPVLAHRSVARVAPGEATRRQEEWTRTVEEASKQCGRPWLPDILPPSPLHAWLQPVAPGDLGLLAALTGPTRPLLHAAREATGVSRVLVAVGPEGDWDPGEAKAFLNAGYAPVTLGPHVLRSETAALAAVLLARAAFAPAGTTATDPS